MLNVWSQRSGYNLGTYNEREIVTVPLPLLPGFDYSSIDISLITGTLPRGLRLVYKDSLSTWVLEGSPLEVPRTTKYTFVLRASNGTSLSDRTYDLTVEGADAPNWTTDEGLLPIGAVTIRTSNISQIKRINNLVTIYTDGYHEFVIGNFVDINSSNESINKKYVELLQPRPETDETEDEYIERLLTTITYYQPGADITLQDATGNISLEKAPLTFVLDSSLVDFTLQATDTDLTAGDNLEFFIADGDGLLPPGLTLSTTGRIYGIVDPILALDLTAREGFYDTNLFDNYPYDFGTKPNISDEDYYSVVTPKKLNRNYEFIVSVTDGETVSKRRFLIFVVGDDFLRADNMLQQIGNASFTADNTYLRAPIWLSANNLGVKRANNYVTIKLDYFDANPEIGPVQFFLEEFNVDGTPSELPDGLYIDPDTAEIFGFVPYQPAITKEFNFTIKASKFDKEDLEYVEVVITVSDDAPAGQNFLKIWPLPEDAPALLIGETIRIGPTLYTITEYIGEDVFGGTQATLRLKENLITNVIDGLTITKQFPIAAGEESTVRSSSKQFTISVLGEIDSVINFITDSDLGDLRPSYPSTLSVVAESTVPNATLIYTLVSGHLPPGIELSSNGTLVGKINQFRSNSISGFTLFDSGDTTFDGSTTTVDKSYKFTINATDQFKFSSVNKEFTISVGTNDITLFSNIYTKPFPKKEKRDLFSNFINDTTIFEPSRIYRLGDPSYGLQTDLKMLVYPGIESKNINEYIAAISKNTKRRRFRLGDVKKAVAKFNGSNDIEYEVIYIEVLDDYENTNGSASNTIKSKLNNPIIINQSKRDAVSGVLGTSSNGVTTYSSDKIESKMNESAYDRFSPTSSPLTVDGTNVKVSGSDFEYLYPSSLSNARDNISQVGRTENDFLPLWMTTPQDNRSAATGFVKAIPICYCKPGEGTYILENIDNASFDFGQLDYEIDRFIIDSDLNDVAEKYLKFTNNRFNI